MTTFKGNLYGIAALMMWSTMTALMRSVAEAFGVATGAALIYTIAAAALHAKERRINVRGIPRAYILGGGFFFALNAITYSMGIGMAVDHRQTLEVGMLNYLWPCLIVVLSIWINNQKLRWMVWPGTVLSLAGIFQCLTSGSDVTLSGFWASILVTPLPYAFGLTAAFSWGLYCNLSARFSKGHNSVPLFFLAAAVALWANFFASNESLHFPGLWPLCELAFIGVIFGVSYSMWETGIHNGNMVLLAVLSYFTPAASMLFLCLWFKTLPPSGFWIGVALVVGGSLLCWLSVRKGARV